MTSRSRLCFITEREFTELVHSIRRRLGVAVALYEARRRDRRRESNEDSDQGIKTGWSRSLTAVDDTKAICVGGSSQRNAVSRVFFSERPIDFEAVDVGNIEVGKLGWVVADLPQSEDSTLYLCQVGTRSDWDDPQTGARGENDDVLQFFERLWHEFKKVLSFPVWAHNTADRESSAQPYPEIGYTEGVATWAREGGELRQPGSANVRFLVRPSANAG